MAERKDSVSLRLVPRNEEASHRVVVGEHSRQGPLGPEGLAKVSEGERVGDEARNQQEQAEGAGEPLQAWEQQPNLTCPVLVSELGASHPTPRLNLWQFFKAGFQTHFKGSRGQEREGTCPRSHSSEALSPSELVAGRSGEDCALSLLVFLQPLLSASAHKSL